MGSEVSSCCGAAADKDTQLDIRAAPEEGQRHVIKSTNVPDYTNEEVRRRTAGSTH